MINVTRCIQNPLIKPQDVKPSREDFKVDGIFNCGVAKYNNEVILLCRVAESVKEENQDVIQIPVVVNKDGRDQIEVIKIVKSENPQYDYSDSRSLWIIDNKGNRKIAYLTSLSHIRLARSKDGVNFVIDDEPFIFPIAKEEGWGMEDPRVTEIDGTFYINYTSVTQNGAATSLISTKDFVSYERHGIIFAPENKDVTIFPEKIGGKYVAFVTQNGAATSLISTKDFVSYERHGIIFAPENKDVTIFPEKIGGKYVAFNRPVPCAIGNPDIWLAESLDLIHWGKQQHFYGVAKDDSWENGRIGGGAVPFKTDKGWIKIYHAADSDNRYCLGAFLLDANDPTKILSKTSTPMVGLKFIMRQIQIIGIA